MMQNCSSFATASCILLHAEMKPHKKLTAIAPNKTTTRYSMEAAIMPQPREQGVSDVLVAKQHSAEDFSCYLG